MNALYSVKSRGRWPYGLTHLRDFIETKGNLQQM